MENEVIIPLFPLGVVLLPEMTMPLHIFEPRYKAMIRECIEEEKQAFLQMTSTEERLRKGIAALGTIHERRRLAQEIRKIVGGNGGVPKSLKLQVMENGAHDEV